MVFPNYSMIVTIHNYFTTFKKKSPLLRAFLLISQRYNRSGNFITEDEGIIYF